MLAAGHACNTCFEKPVSSHPLSFIWLVGLMWGLWFLVLHVSMYFSDLWSSQLQLSKDLKRVGSLINKKICSSSDECFIFYVCQRVRTWQGCWRKRQTLLSAIAGKVQMTCEKCPFSLLPCKEENYFANLIYIFKEQLSCWKIICSSYLEGHFFPNMSNRTIVSFERRWLHWEDTHRESRPMTG